MRQAAVWLLCGWMLLVAEPASADCGWVLWKQSSYVAPGRAEKTAEWALVEGSESRYECEKRAEWWTKAVANRTTSSPGASQGAEVVITGNSVTVYRNERTSSSTTDYQCLPAAADPRARFKE